MEFFDEGTANGESKSEFVYRVLRDNILNGTYGPGAALYIRELSSQLQRGQPHACEGGHQPLGV